MATVETVKPVASQESAAEKLEKVTVTVAEGEVAAIISADAVKLITAAYGLQDDYDNESMFQRDALAHGALLFLKAEVQRAIGQWDNLVTKMSKTTRYRNRYTREQLDKFLRTHPKCKDIYKRAAMAATLKAQF